VPLLLYLRLLQLLPFSRSAAFPQLLSLRPSPPPPLCFPNQVDSTLTDADAPFFPPAAATTASDGPSSLPPSEATTAAVWVELVDEGTGRLYYYNNVSQATQWIMPLGFQVRFSVGGFVCVCVCISLSSDAEGYPAGLPGPFSLLVGKWFLVFFPCTSFVPCPPLFPPNFFLRFLNASAYQKHV